MAIRVAENIRVGTPECNTSAVECQVNFDRTTRTISLTQGKVAIVDVADYKFLSCFKWHTFKSSQTYYAVRKGQRSKSGRQQTILMHRIILNAPDGIQIDHINSNGLDNRRSNLRLCNRSENNRHQRMRHDNTAGFKGVTYHDRLIEKPYKAKIKLSNKSIHLGYYQTAEEAARAYDQAALKYHHDFALTNEMLELLSKRVKVTADVSQREQVTT